jgi:hypothetical protein
LYRIKLRNEVIVINKGGIMKGIVLLASICMIVGLSISGGCASYMSYDASRGEIRSQRAIKAVKLGDGAGVGIDIAALDALTEHPIRQTLAALLDAGTIYALVEGIDSLNDSSKDDDSTTSGDSVDINISGGGDNTITVSGDTSTSTVSDDNSSDDNHSDNSTN